MKKIQLPAIKGIIGDWVYYQACMPFSEVVSRIDNDHSYREYKSLDDYLQRDLSSRSKKISEYLIRERTHFFNTAIIGLFGDRPQWYTFGYAKGVIPELSLSERMAQTVGVLELSGDEILFSIDGQHRIEGIKQALKKQPELFNLDELPIIIVAHNDDKKGKQRTRRLFSEINTKAQKVTGLDDLITNEDNPILINSRKLYAEYKPFNKDEFGYSGAKVPLSGLRFKQILSANPADRYHSFSV
jgi:DNA sulfur modification protein DndB